MKIDVVDLLKKVGNEAEAAWEEDLSFPEDGLDIRGPVKIKVRLVNTGDSILMTGSFKATVRLACVRCLKEFDLPMSVDVEEEYTTRALERAMKSGEVELKDRDFKFKIEDNKIDLTEAVRQNLLTALPIKPLCKKICAGLKEDQGKKRSGPDPRLEKLRDALKNMKKG